MGHHIKRLSVENEYRKDYNLSTIDNLSKVNIFIGSNNSGKSRFLRRIFGTNKSLSFVPSNDKVNFDEYYNLLLKFADGIVTQMRSPIIKIGNLNKNTIIGDLQDNLLHHPLLKEGEDLFSYFNGLVNDIYELNDSSDLTLGKSSGYSIYKEQIISNLKKLATDYQMKMKKLTPSGATFYISNFNRVYIPTLRGLRGFADSIKTNNDDKDMYKNRTKKDYFKETPESCEIHTGLNLYDEIIDMLLGSVQQRYNMQRFQEFLSASFFDGQQVTLTPDRHSDIIKVKIGVESEKNIFELGDGIQSLIILIFPLFKYLNENLLLFIEEPELYLHPGMQRKFIEILMNEQFANHQFFFTTHSNHFLDMTLDIDSISIYKFKKKLGEHSGISTEELNPTFTIENVSNEDDSVLQELGVRNSSVLLSNCTIWVEGITDRYYIRHFFKLYQEEKSKTNPNFLQFKEDTHYSFIEYSGGNITHWSFLDDYNQEEDENFSSINVKSICRRIFLIADNDGGKKTERLNALKEVLHENFYGLECNEIENILEADTLKKIIAEYEKVKDPEKLNFTSEFTRNDYKDLYIGKFIDDHLTKEYRKRETYQEKSGTIKDKLSFCKKAIKSITRYEELSDEAQMLCENLYEFIKLNNV
ncbi:ATP-binding protein [Niallia taxi]|uniref:AAA family ATPase n=1 Tax=Niallia taxi TaxID=2499688 RepID=UPI003D2B332B